jgi:hypothetical protein
MTLFVMLRFQYGRARRTHSTLSSIPQRVVNAFFSTPESKKPAVRRVSLIGTWQCPTLTWGNPTLPSALIRFTSEFGMGSGGTVSLWLPRNLVTIWESLILIQSVSNYFLLYLLLACLCLQRQLLFEAF